MQINRVVFHWRLHVVRKRHFKVSHLCYAIKSHPQYQVVVKLPGSFRLAAGRRHLHRHCIFTKLFLETVPQSLHHSCTSKITRLGISLMYSFIYTHHGLYLIPSLIKSAGHDVGLLLIVIGLHIHFCMQGNLCICLLTSTTVPVLNPITYWMWQD